MVEVASEIHTGPCGVCRRYAGKCRPGVSGPSPIRLCDRLRQLAGSELDHGSAGSTVMMRPFGEDLKVYLCRTTGMLILLPPA